MGIKCRECGITSGDSALPDIAPVTAVSALANRKKRLKYLEKTPFERTQQPHCAHQHARWV
jgi:hypothetical protein